MTEHAVIALAPQMVAAFWWEVPQIRSLLLIALLTAVAAAIASVSTRVVGVGAALALSGAALVITDIKLRGMSGLELFDKLRLLAVPPPPVLFISGHADENMQRYALDLGAAAFLRKPINIDILLDHIQREMARRQ